MLCIGGTIISTGHEPAAPLDDKRITWHTAFCDAIRLDLIQYHDVLEFDIEHSLTREPLRIDLVIIKKRKEARIEKPIAALFKEINIVEYKSPEDSLNVADFHQVMAYAHLYCTPPEKGAINEITITFVTTKEPREVKNHLRDIYHYTLTEKWPGITLIEGDVIAMQIIERKKLSAANGLWLAALGRDLSAERLKAIIDESKKIPKGALGAYMYMLVKANSRQVREVMRMSDTAIIDALFVELGAAARWEAKGEAKGKAIWEARGEAIGEVRGEAKGKVIGEAKGKAIGKIEVAKNLKDMGDPVEKIALVTGLSPAEIANL